MPCSVPCVPSSSSDRVSVCSRHSTRSPALSTQASFTPPPQQQAVDAARHLLQRGSSQQLRRAAPFVPALPRALVPPRGRRPHGPARVRGTRQVSGARQVPRQHRPLVNMVVYTSRIQYIHYHPSVPNPVLGPPSTLSPPPPFPGTCINIRHATMRQTRHLHVFSDTSHRDMYIMSYQKFQLKFGMMS